MMKKLTGLALLLTLAACDTMDAINQPKPPRLEGQWQCSNGISITFSGQQNYSVVGAAGELAGVYKLMAGENNYHGIEWNSAAGDAPPLPSRLRYFETDKLRRLYFYTHLADEAVRCEQAL